MVPTKVIIGIVAIVIIAAAGLLVATPTLTQTTVAPKPETPPAPAQPVAALPAPPPTGTLLVYGSIDAEDLQPLVNAFQAKFPQVKVEYVRGSPSEVFTRITTELQAGKKTADLTLVSYPGTLQLIREDIYRPYKSPVAEGYPADLKAPDGLWTSVVLLGQGIIYNKNLVPQNELPKTLADLTDAKWKGKITMHDYTQGTTATQIFASLAEKIGKDKVTKFLTDLEANVKPVRDRSTSAVSDNVVRGEYAIGIVAQLHDIVKAKNAGAPVEVLQVSDFPLMLSPTPAAILKTAENNRAAEAFVDFLLTDEAQKIIGNIEVRFPAKNVAGAKFTIENSAPKGMEIYRYPSPSVFQTIDQWTADFKKIAAAK